MEKRPEREADQLDKFKRRLIRSVAWMLIHEKTPEDEVWRVMKKVMGCDCKQLWEHMKSLTQKKLRRLLVAEDRYACIPEIARMSLTDWQLYDQVLVHEDLDVIGLHTMNPYKPDNKVLIDLFALVQRFDIEVKSGDKLADAWSAATVYYNSQGHQCSPMLLQKRWHQLKAETRRRFYEYWQAYRGNEKQLPKAEQYRPTVLQRTMARRFPEIITAKFPDWETCIEESLVILPDDFETRKNIKVLSNPCNENTPDIVVMEPQVETVDLVQESDSDEENSQEESPEINNDKDESDSVAAVAIKVEPEDTVIDYTANQKSKKTDLAIAHTVEQETLFDNINDDDDIVEMTAEEHNIITIPSGFEESEATTDDNGDDKHNNIDSDDVFIPKITNVFGNVNMSEETLSMLDNLTRNAPWSPKPESKRVEGKDQETSNDKKVSDGPVCLRVDILDSNDDTDGEVELINERAIKESTLRTDVSPVIVNTVSLKPNVDADAVLSKIPDKTTTSVKNTNTIDCSDTRKLQFGCIDLSSFGEISEDMNFADDGIEIIDAGLPDPPKDIVKKEAIKKNDVNDNEDAANTETKGSISENQEFNLDNKLFLDPVVYTMKLDDMDFLKDKSIDTINVKTLLNKIILESKPISDRSVDAEKSRIDRQRVSLSNSMLQKPKNRSYNPIQLCKNPDFNTRLKRLTAGFLSSWQNRTLLKACKPLTIDLAKTFESKLINNTIYLKKSDNNSVIQIDGDETESTSVIPSVMPVQTLMDNTRLDDVLKLKTGYSSSSSQASDNIEERNKVIHLPDITQVRRINQTLLTAEVTPIQIQNTSNVSKLNDMNIKSTLTGINTNNDILNAHGSNSDKVGIVQPVGKTASESSMLAKMLVAPAQAPVFKNPIESCLNNNSQTYSTEPKRDKIQKKYTSAAFKGTLSRSTMPSWIKGYPQPGSKDDDILLTIDTLHKMLFLFNGNNKHQLTLKQKKKFKKQIEKKKERKPPPKEPEPKPKIKQSENESTNTEPRRVLTKILYRSAFCCWSREQIEYFTTETNKRRKAHSCLKTEPYTCRCCCKEELEKIVAVAKIRPEAVFPPTPWRDSPEKSQKDTVHRVVPDNVALQANHSKETDVPAIASVYTLNSTVEGELPLNPDVMLPSHNLINDVVEQTQFTPHKSDDETVQLNIPIYDDTQLIKPATKSKNVTPPKKNVAPNIPIYKVNRVTESLPNPVPTLDLSEVEHQNLDIPIYDDTQLNKSVNRPLTSSTSVFSGKLKLNIPIHDETKLTQQMNADVIEEVVDVTIKISKKPKPLLETLDGPIKLGNMDKKLKKCTCPSKTLNKIKNNVIDNTDETQKSFKQSHDDEVKVTSVPSNKGKVLILNSKQMMKFPAGCPIFLGTNTILLTDVKFPRSIQESSQNQFVLNDSQHVIPPLPLPFGVQLVLLQNGQLTYITKPGVQLSPENKAKMPELIQTIQAQMNLPGISSLAPVTTSGNVSIASDVVDISDDETSTVVNNVNLTSAALSDDQNNENISDLNSSKDEIEISQTILKDIPIDKPSIDLNLQVKNTETQITDKEDVLIDNQKIIEQKNEKRVENTSMDSSSSGTPSGTHTAVDNVGNNALENTNTNTLNENNEMSSISKKTILSDLMEMSGISAEDTVQTSPTKDEGKLHPYISIPSVSLPPSDNPVQYINQLSSISSFAELKYACNNNGKFYKLDFETGVVVPVNVCLKKKPQASSLSVIPIAPKETIDLTEDYEISASIENTTQVDKVNPKPHDQLVKVLKTKMHNVRPVTMFRTLKRPRILKRDNQTLAGDLQIIKTPLGRSREVRLTYLAPVKENMEKRPQPARQKRKSSLVPAINLSLSESSDDEPLIKKVRRKQNEAIESDSNSAFKKEYQKHPIAVRKLTKGPEDDPNALAEDDIRLFEDPPNQRFGWEKSDVINYAPNQDDDSGDEDCILGV